MTTKDKILITDLKKILLEKYGELVIGIYCFGSRVGKNNLDSDFDVLVLTDKKIGWREELELSKSIVHYGISNDIVFDIQFLSRKEFDIDFKFHPFIQSIKSTGLYI